MACFTTDHLRYLTLAVRVGRDERLLHQFSATDDAIEPTRERKHPVGEGTVVPVAQFGDCHERAEQVRPLGIDRGEGRRERTPEHIGRHALDELGATSQGRLMTASLLVFVEVGLLRRLEGLGAPPVVFAELPLQRGDELHGIVADELVLAERLDEFGRHLPRKVDEPLLGASDELAPGAGELGSTNPVHAHGLGQVGRKPELGRDIGERVERVQTQDQEAMEVEADPPLPKLGDEAHALRPVHRAALGEDEIALHEELDEVGHGLAKDRDHLAVFTGRPLEHLAGSVPVAVLEIDTDERPPLSHDRVKRELPFRERGDVFTPALDRDVVGIAAVGVAAHEQLEEPGRLWKLVDARGETDFSVHPGVIEPLTQDRLRRALPGLALVAVEVPEATEDELCRLMFRSTQRLEKVRPERLAQPRELAQNLTHRQPVGRAARLRLGEREADPVALRDTPEVAIGIDAARLRGGLDIDAALHEGARIQGHAPHEHRPLETGRPAQGVALAVDRLIAHGDDVLPGRRPGKAIRGVHRVAHPHPEILERDQLDDRIPRRILISADDEFVPHCPPSPSDQWLEVEL